MKIVMSLNLFLLFVTVVAIVYVSRNRRHPASPIGVLFVTAPAEVRVKAVERNSVAATTTAAFDASRVVAIVCGADKATADRYEARNDALRSIARRRDLPEDDAAALLAYLRRSDDAMRIERAAALKNDVMNLLRNQDPPVEGLAETLIAMFRSGKHPPAVLDYCIQHLGAMQGEITDDALRCRIRETFVLAARQTRQPYAGTALYSLAAKGADSERMSRWSKRNVFPSKIAMGIVFVILGVLVLPKFGGFIVDTFLK